MRGYISGYAPPFRHQNRGCVPTIMLHRGKNSRYSARYAMHLSRRDIRADVVDVPNPNAVVRLWGVCKPSYTAAARGGNPTALQLLLPRGVASPRQVSYCQEGETPLPHCCGAGSLPHCFRLLLQGGLAPLLKKPYCCCCWWGVGGGKTL